MTNYDRRNDDVVALDADGRSAASARVVARDGVDGQALSVERRGAIVSLLETMNDGLPDQPQRRAHSEPGFVNEPRSRTCPDCLANGRTKDFACETCHGSGTISPENLAQVALPDVLPGDGDTRDPYAVTGKVPLYGVGDTAKFGHVPERDAKIDRARQLGKDRPASEQQAALDTAPYVWERERATMFARFDYLALNVALEHLRDRHPQLAAAVVSVHTHRLVEPSATLEAAVERGLRFISLLMPATIRAPGMTTAEHPAAARVRRNAA